MPDAHPRFPVGTRLPRAHEVLVLTVVAAACSTPGRVGSSQAGEADTSAVVEIAPVATCHWRAEAAELAERLSPPDSVRFSIGDAEALLCYSRPSARGRVMIGGDRVPYGEVWRTGANEPTTLHLGFAADIAGVRVDPGTYTLYTVPRPGVWEIIVNRSTEQWGAERYYTSAIEAMEAGRGAAPAHATDAHVETLRFRVALVAADAVHLTLEWEGTQLPIPIRRLR